jgi:phospholipid-binding lipoprotein MlaA
MKVPSEKQIREPNTMKWLTHPVLLLFLLISGFGCAHSPHSGTSSPSSGGPPPYEEVAVASSPDPTPPDSPAVSPESEGGKTDNVSDSPAPLASPEIPSNSDNMNLDYVEEEKAPEKADIADPLESFNRAMYHFNDKFYFWVLKPVARGYGKVVPEVARIGVRNFFSNIASPIRIVNSVLQAKFVGAVKELGRFAINTVWGIGGLMDLASENTINLPKQDADFGQTLGIYGLGQGFYIHWPILGPSSPRDTVGMIGDAFLHPFTYFNETRVLVVWAGIKVVETVNTTSLSIGDYESLKSAAVDPYVAIRDAYVQYRLKKIKTGGGKPAPSDTGGAISPATTEDRPSGSTEDEQ